MADRRDLSTRTGPLASFLFVALCFAQLAGCGDRDSVHTYAGSTMGTTYHIRVVTGDARVPDDLGEGIKGVLDRLDQAMSTYKPSSELNRLNRAPVGQPFPVSSQMLDVLTLSEQIYRLTDGAFDPSVGPLVDLWGFGPTDTGDRIPEPAEIAKLLKERGFDKLAIDKKAGTVTRKAPVQLDLSAIAKGYAVDRVSQYLTTRGFPAHMVEVGGEVYLAGDKASGEPWRIAVETPIPGERGVERVLNLTNTGIATSGNYRNFFVKNGRRYSHEIDPRTGYPVNHNLASVTVLADTCAKADALATAFMVMGDREALKKANTLDIPVFLIVKKGDGFVEHYNKLFKPYLTKVD